MATKNTLIDSREAQPSAVPFKRQDLYGAQVLQKSGWNSAGVFVFARGGASWAVKDYSQWPLVLRETFGAWMVRRELSAVRKLKGVEGIPRDMFCLDRHALCYRFVPAALIDHGVYHLLSRDYFHKLEKLVRRIHERGVVHLDLRGKGNVLVTEAGDPLLLDFSSHLDMRYLPPALCSMLKDIDLSGVYKHWSRCFELDPERRRLLVRMDRLRMLWLFADLFRLGLWVERLKAAFIFLGRSAAAAGHRAANNIALRRLVTRLRVPLYLAGAGGLLFAAQPRWFFPALALSLAGEAIQVWCFAALDKNRSIASEGPYAFSRNPMYIGRFFVCLGMAVLTGSFYLTAGFVVCYYFYVVNRVRREELRLRALFGDLYGEYCVRVPRFIPRVRRWPGELARRFDAGLLFRNHGIWNALAVIGFYLAVAWRIRNFP